MDTENESNQADRTISTGKLHALLHFHTRPINVVVFHGSQGNARFEVGFPLRCFQRLSRPYIAMLHCRWRDNSSTRGTVSYTHLRAHETPEHLVCRLLLEKKKN